MVSLLKPANSSLNTSVPLLHHSGSLLLSSLGSKLGHTVSVDVLEILNGLPDANSKAGSNGSTKSSGLSHGGSLDLNAENVGLDLHGNVRVGHTTVNSQLGEGLTRVLGHSVEDGSGLEAGGLEGGSADMGLGGELGETKDGTSGISSPVGGEETGQSGDENDTGGVLNLGGQLSNLLRGLNEANVVSQPLDAGASHGDGALKSVDGLGALEVVTNGGQQTVVGDDGLLSSVVEQEAAGTVCVLGLTGLKGLLADEGGRLVTETASKGNVGEGTGSDSAVDLSGGHNLGENELLDTEELDELLVVLEGLNVHEHGSRGIRSVCDVGATVETAGKVVQQPRINGGEGELASVVALLDLLDVVEHPSDLDTGKVGGKGQTTELGDLVRALLGLELLDSLAGSGVGPHNGVVEGLAGLNVPENGGLSLVGDTNGLDVSNLDAERSHLLGHGAHTLQARGDELFGIVLHPSGVGVDLGELDLVRGNGLSVGRKENESGGSGSLVECAYVGCHVVFDGCCG